MRVNLEELMLFLKDKVGHTICRTTVNERHYGLVDFYMENKKE